MVQGNLIQGNLGTQAASIADIAPPLLPGDIRQGRGILKLMLYTVRCQQSQDHEVDTLSLVLSFPCGPWMQF